MTAQQRSELGGTAVWAKPVSLRLCCFASTWEIKRRNCGFVDQPCFKGSHPGQPRPFLPTPSSTVNLKQGGGRAWPPAAWPQSKSCAGRPVPQVVRPRYPARTAEIRAPRGPLPLLLALRRRADSDTRRAAAKGKRG